ncbi:MAG TPA: DUF3592 domain-containing protein [Gemmatimonadaceae bacterium]|nr:DUF3592 domain-containing protein [Gemmatimonadaceae bacterium]
MGDATDSSEELESSVQERTSIKTPGTPQGDDLRGLVGSYGLIPSIILLGMSVVFYRDVWPLLVYRQTPAVIDSTWIEAHDGRRGNRYIPRVHFTYSVAGQTYHGSRVTPADLKGNWMWANKVSALYKPGATVPAYYDPRRPEQSFLLRSTGEFVGYLAAGIAVIGLYTWSVAGEVRRRLRLMRGEAARTSNTMPNIPAKADARDRVISITVASVSLVLGALPLIGLSAAVMTQPLHRPRIMLAMVLVLQAALIGISVIIFHGLRHGNVFAWRGVGRLGSLLTVLILFLGMMIQAETGRVSRSTSARLSALDLGRSILWCDQFSMATGNCRTSSVLSRAHRILYRSMETRKRICDTRVGFVPPRGAEARFTVC